EISFSSERKLMSVIYEIDGKKIYSKGAPEILLEKCNRILLNGKVKKLDEKNKKDILEKNKRFASSALRVLGFAFKEGEEEKDLIWLGLQAMMDPPRPEVKKAIKEASNAGIRTIMITGDNAETAKAIADKIGLFSKEVITGWELEKMNQQELAKKLEDCNIFARVNPEHKLKILELLGKENRVAMTGDGVNDALALKRAGVGIAMGIKGTDVAKEASDIILLDDNFSTIITSVREGRRVFDNIRKFVNYLFTCNVAEIGLVFLSTLLLTLKEPALLPVHLLWINLLTDGLPALALGADPARKDIMNKPARRKGEHILDRKTASSIISIGVLMICLLFLVFFLILPSGLNEARTALFTGFILFEFVRIASIRYGEKVGWFDNKLLLGALLLSLLLQLLLIYTPLNQYFHILPLSLSSWFILLVFTFIGFVASIGISKFIERFVDWVFCGMDFVGGLVGVVGCGISYHCYCCVFLNKSC
ncbi:MAG: cation-translocating P-type ATPase, partial [Candidatus Nanoarchaeia archaeon]